MATKFQNNDYPDPPLPSGCFWENLVRTSQDCDATPVIEPVGTMTNMLGTWESEASIGLEFALTEWDEDLWLDPETDDVVLTLTFENGAVATTYPGGSSIYWFTGSDYYTGGTPPESGLVRVQRAGYDQYYEVSMGDG